MKEISLLGPATNIMAKTSIQKRRESARLLDQLHQPEKMVTVQILATRQM
jgi:hypothetical protein